MSRPTLQGSKTRIVALAAAAGLAVGGAVAAVGLAAADSSGTASLDQECSFAVHNGTVDTGSFNCADQATSAPPSSTPPTTEPPTSTAPPTTPPPTETSPPPTEEPPAGDLHFVQATNAYATTSNETVSKQYTDPVHAGDTLVAAVSFDSANTLDVSATDSQGNTWHVAKVQNDTTNGQASAVLYGQASADGIDNVTVKFGSEQPVSVTFRYIAISEYDGPADFIGATSAVNTDTTPTPGPLNTEAGLLSVGVLNLTEGPQSATAVPTYTVRTDAHQELWLEDKMPAGANPEASWSIGTAATSVALEAEFAVAGSGVEPPPTTTAPPTTTPPPTSSSPPPASGDFPDENTTGNVGHDTGYEPTGVTLHSCSYSSGVTSYDSCNFSGGMNINTPNVHITRSLINGQVRSNSSGLVISDTTINCHCGSDNTQTPPAVYGGGFTLNRDNIYNMGHGVQIADPNVTVENSWFHGHCCSGNEAHEDSIISNGVGSGDNNVLIQNNYLDGAGGYMSAAFGLFGDFGPFNGWTVDHNLFNTTGSYCLYGGGPSSKPYEGSNMHYTNNHFGKKYNSQCGIYGPATANDGPGYVWSGNVWDATGEPVN